MNIQDIQKLNIGELHHVREALGITTLNELMNKFKNLDPEDFDEMLRIIKHMIHAFNLRTNSDATLESANEDVCSLGLPDIPVIVNILLNGVEDPIQESPDE